MIPYFLWNGLFLIPKFIFQQFISDVVSLDIASIAEMFFAPKQTVLQHTWFLFALFEMFVLTIVFDKLRRRNNLIVQTTALLLLLANLGIESLWFAASDVSASLIYFWAGLVLGNYRVDDIEKTLSDKAVQISIVIVAFAAHAVWISGCAIPVNKQVMALSMIFLIMMVQVRFSIANDFIEFVSRNSFAIYILHWPVQIFVRLICYQILDMPASIVVVLNLVLGFGIPALAALIVSKIKARPLRKLCRIVLGI